MMRNSDRLAAIRLFAAMITDAKLNMIAMYRRSQKRKLKNEERKLFDDSRRWLLNGNGGLADMMGMTSNSVPEALAELREFALDGYKTVSEKDIASDD